MFAFQKKEIHTCLFIYLVFQIKLKNWKNKHMWIQDGICTYFEVIANPTLGVTDGYAPTQHFLVLNFISQPFFSVWMPAVHCPPSR